MLVAKLLGRRLRKRGIAKRRSGGSGLPRSVSARPNANASARSRKRSARQSDGRRRNASGKFARSARPRLPLSVQLRLQRSASARRRNARSGKSVLRRSARRRRKLREKRRRRRRQSGKRVSASVLLSNSVQHRAMPALLLRLAMPTLQAPLNVHRTTLRRRRRSLTSLHLFSLLLHLLPLFRRLVLSNLV